MPYINIRVATQLSQAQKTVLFETTTGLMNRTMGKRREVTVVHIDESGPQQWSTNGKTLQADSPVGAYIDVKITQGTNSDTEKAELIAKLVQMLGENLGTIQEACYVVVDEIAATSWGYNGKTQAARAAEKSN